LADHALRAPGTPIKEYQIATEVFGRPADFDPRLDSTVRVQTGRLRSKLSEYYGGPGAEDRVIVELPKGSYSLTIHERVLPEPPPPVAPVLTAVPALIAAPTPGQRHPFVVGFWILAALSAGLLVALVALLIGRQAAPSSMQAKAAPVFHKFWQEFIDTPERPWVIFSNAEFIGRPETGMRYYDARRDPGTSILDHYTGVGEVLGIHELDSLFTSLNHSVRVKRGRLLSLDDAKNNDLIFIGSPTENLSLRELPTTQDFVFRLADSGPRKGDLNIVNMKPRTGEDAAFWGSPTVPISEDHALIALVPGMNSSRWIMILAGTTTIGTQAAVEFVTREKNVQELVDKVEGPDGKILAFEAVIRVKVTGGVPVGTQLVALHVRSTS
jgi:hypothetical protein